MFYATKKGLRPMFPAKARKTKTEDLHDGSAYHSEAHTAPLNQCMHPVHELIRALCVVQVPLPRSRVS